jgi:hypothetical protein
VQPPGFLPVLAIHLFSRQDLSRPDLTQEASYEFSVLQWPSRLVD